MSGLVRSAANAVGGSNFSPFDVDTFAFDSTGPGDMDYLCEPNEDTSTKDGEVDKQWIEKSNIPSSSDSDIEKSNASSESDKEEPPIFGR